MQREEATRVQHPDILWDWTRVDPTDHPGVDALYHGAPDLGWEGDERLCLYKNDEARAVCLVRLEADGEYRLVCRRDATSDERLFLGTDLLGPQAINQLIRHLIAHDSRRGFDAAAHVIDANDAKHAANDKALDEWIGEEIAPMLAFALQRSYLPGIDTVMRQVPSRK